MEKAMFDRLVESSRQKQGMRAGGYLLITGLIYALALVVFVALAVIGFNPVLADESSFLAGVTLPRVPADHLPGRPDQDGRTTIAPVRAFGTITKMPDTILPGTNASERRLIPITGVFPPLSGGGRSLIMRETGEPAPPPPAPTPLPKIEPAPEVKSGPSKVSEGVLQGRAIKKVRPGYPEIARRNRIGGLVQVQVLISEDGRVMEAFIINGHPLLRNAAIEAARQWIFTPTMLSKVPVKVQGVLSFNFMLE
jgi:periplasmic protein TonB